MPGYTLLLEDYQSQILLDGRVIVNNSYSARTAEEVLRFPVENVAAALEAKGCSLMLLTPDRKLLLHTVATGLSNCI